MAALNVAISIVAVKLIGLPGIYLGTVLSRVLTQVWFDPLVVYKHAFKRSPKGYFLEYAIWLVILGVSFAAASAVNNLVVIPIPVLSFAVHGLICAAIVCGFTVLTFGRTEIFRSSLGYMKKTAKRLIKKH